MPITLATNVVIADRFRLNRQLGRGGMGSVWHATHLGLDIPCAVKFIEGSHASLPEAHARFEREAKAAAQLRSPNVVQVLDHGVFEDTPYIAMELLDGEDLGKRLMRLHRLPPPEVLKIVSQVGRALTRAHALGIVHRDLKPDNIFLVRDDDREIAKVLDFGIAKATGANAVEGSATKTGAMLGTPYYMSPEQAQGIRAVDHRSDLWSLAVIVYQALTGKLPFESEALGDLLIQLIVAPVPVPSQVVSDLPPGFDAWFAKAAQRDPSMRFQSAKDLTEGLSLALGLSSGSDMRERQYTPGSMPPPPMGTGVSSPQRATPQPGAGTLAITPPPALGTTPSPMTPVPTTGGPMSRTYGGPAPSKRPGAGAMVALGGIGLVVVVASIVGISYAVKGKGAGTASAAGPAMVEPTATASAAVAATAPPAPLPSATLEPPASTSAAATAPPASVSAASAKPAVPVFVPPTVPGKPPPTPGPGKKKPVDLGI
ncbi:MAG: serine/threonine-protein kinase [Polyangiaceae bacterium]